MERFNCFICNKFINNGLNGLSSHFRYYHGLTISSELNYPGFVCGQNGCVRNFVHFYDLRKHMRNKHSGLLCEAAIFQQVANDEVNNFNRGDENGEIVDNYQADYIDNVEVIDNEECQENDRNIDLDLKTFIINMIARLHSHSSMTGSIVNSIVKELEEILSYLQSFLQIQINEKIKLGNIINEELIENISNILNFNTSFYDLSTIDGQINLLVENYGYIQPIEIPLGRRIDTVLDSKTLTYVPTTVIEKYQYVPIIEVLKLVLSNVEVRQSILSERPSLDGTLSSFVDGEHFKTHPFLQKYKHAIRLKLYYDELEIVNPLGSKTSVHKLAAFYYQIDNLPPHMNSELASIHVLLLCSHEDVKKYGFSKILSPFIDDLVKLESDEGIELKFGNDELFTLRGTLVSFCGDGLAVHEVYNLLGPSASKFCRMCMFSGTDLHAGTFQEREKRTEQLFNEQLQFLRRSNFSDAAKTATGLKGDSCLNNIRYFHISYNKVFDIMHDFLCGICPMIIKLVLHKYIVIDRKFDVAFVNGAISQFNYGYLENKNKPSPNFTETMLCRKDHTLSQKAMQTWNLVRSLPFILTNQIDDEDGYMNLILYLLRIMEIVFAPKLTVTIMPYLDSLIRDFSMHFKNLFPNVNFINKFHHLFHYVECIMWSGPLALYNCIRFEGKHSECKLRAQNMHNFKNPPKTIIRVCQCTQSIKWGTKNIQSNRLRVVSGRSKFVQNTKSKNGLIDLGKSADDLVFCAKSVFVNGIEFRNKLFVIVEIAALRSDNLLVFGCIEEILSIDQEVFLDISICETLFFDTSVHAYCVKSNNSIEFHRFIKTSDLPFFKPVCHWRKPGSDALYISLRHVIL